MKKLLVIAFAMIAMPMISSAQFITPPPVTLSVASSPTAVVPGGKSTVSWVAHNASSCTFNGPLLDIASFGFPTGPASPIGSRVVTLTSDTGPVNGTITCFSNSGLAPVQAPIRVGLLPAKVVITVTASPTAVVPGDKSTVTWSAINATSCKFDSITRFGFPIGNAAPTGSQVVAPTTATGPVNGMVTCNNNGLATSTASIRVSLLPAITITASPSAVVPGGTSTVSWTAKNKASCTFDSDIYNLTPFGFPTGNVPATGSAVVTLTSATGPAYGTITCRDIYGLSPVRAYVRVGLLPPPVPAVTISVTASSSATVSGTISTVSWVANNASSCTFDHELQDITSFGFATGTVATIGSQAVFLTPETGAVYGTITCRDINGLKPVQAPVRVGLLTPPAPAITVSVTASLTAVFPGQPSIVNWSSTNATACTFDSELLDLTRFGFPAGYAPLSGSQVVTPTLATGPVNGTLTCYNNLGSVPVRVPVRVGLITPPPPVIVW